MGRVDRPPAAHRAGDPRPGVEQRGDDGPPQERPAPDLRDLQPADHASATSRACVTTLRDITQQQRSEAALKASEEKFAKAFHSSPDAITITERDTGRYLEVNDGFCRLTGYRAEEAIGRTVYQIWVSGPTTKQRTRACWPSCRSRAGSITWTCSGATSAASC